MENHLKLQAHINLWKYVYTDIFRCCCCCLLNGISKGMIGKYQPAIAKDEIISSKCVYLPSLKPHIWCITWFAHGHKISLTMPTAVSLFLVCWCYEPKEGKEKIMISHWWNMIVLVIWIWTHTGVSVRFSQLLRRFIYRFIRFSKP